MKKRIISIFLAIMMMLGMVIPPSPAYALTKDEGSTVYEKDLPIEEIDGEFYKAIDFEDVASKGTNSYEFYIARFLSRLEGTYATGTPTKPSIENYYVDVDVDQFFFKGDALGFEMKLYVQDRTDGKIIGVTQAFSSTGRYYFKKTKNWDENKTYDVGKWQMIYRPDLGYDIRILRGENQDFKGKDVVFMVAPCATPIYKAEYFTTDNKVPTVKVSRVGIYGNPLGVRINTKNLDPDEYYSFAQAAGPTVPTWYKGKKITISKFGGDSKEVLEVSNQASADLVKMYLLDPNVQNGDPDKWDDLKRGPDKFTQDGTTYHYLITGDYNNPHIFTFREELKVSFDLNGGKWTDTESGKEKEAKTFPIGHSMKLNEKWGDITAVTVPADSTITPPEVKQNNQTVTNNFLGWNTDSNASTALSENDLNNLQFTEPVTTFYAIYSQHSDGKAKIDYIDNATGKSITIGENQKIARQTYPSEKEGAVNTAILESVFDKDSAPKILGYKFNRVEVQPTDGKYTADATSTIKIYYDKVDDIVNGHDDDGKVVPKPDGYVTVTFEPGDCGTLTGEKTYYVNPKAGKTNADITEPTIKAKTGFKVAEQKWKPDFAKDTAITADAAYTAQYTTVKDVVPGTDPETKKPNEKPEGYKTVTFDLDGKGTTKDETVFYVNPEKEVTLTAPTVTGIKGYTVKTGDEAWSPKFVAPATYKEDKTFVAQYTFSNVSDKEVKGFNKVTFKPGDHGTLTEKSVWVQPDTIVDISDKAPKVTPAENYSHIGWKPGLIGKFADGTEVVAQYSDSISEKPVQGWTEILFNSGEHGRFDNGTRNVRWVNPKVPVALDFMTEKIVPYINYSFDKWKAEDNSLSDLKTATMYKKDTSFTGTYKLDVSYTEGDITITFKPGDHGRFKDGAKTTLYVPNNKEVDLTEFAPAVIPDQNYGHSGWDTALKRKFTQATDITAQYIKGTFKPDELASIDVFGPTKLSYAEGDKLDLAGLKIVVKDKAGIQQTYEGAKAITDAGFKITPANETPLIIKDHDKKPIKVSKEITVGQGKKPIEGESISTLSVSMNKSEEPTDVLARNLGENPKNTTVTGKAPKDSVIKVTDIDGKDLTDGTEVKADAKGEFIITLKEKLAPGTPVKVTSTEPGKTESSPVVKQVFEDVNKDGTDDEKQKSAMPTDVKALNQNKVGQDGKPTKEAKETTTVTGKAKAGAVITITDKDGKALTTEPTEVKADQSGNFTAEIPRQNDGTVIKVTAKEADKALPSDPALASVATDADNDNQADGERVTLRPSALARNIGTGTTTPKTPATFTTVEGDTEKDASVTVSYTFNGQTKTKTVKADTQGTNGLYTYKAELADKLPAGTVVTVKAIVVGKKESTPTDAIVFEDLDGDKKPDGQGKLDFTKIVDFKLASNPNKMEYPLASDKDKDKATLDLTGLKVFLKDASGNTGIYEYNKTQDSPFEELKGNENFKLELVKDQVTEIKDKDTEKTKLGKTDDQSKVKASLVNVADKVVETSAIKVYVDADKNGIADDKETTERPAAIASNKGKDPKFTSIEVKTEKGAVITVKANVPKAGSTTGEKELKDVVVTNNKATSEDTFIVQATLDEKPLPNGTEILVYAENAPKTISKPQITTVFNDFNNDGKPDGGKVDLTKIKDMQVIDPDNMEYIEGDETKGKLDLKGLKVVVRDTLGGIQIFSYNTDKNQFMVGDKAFDDFTVKVDNTAVQQGTTLTSKDHNNKKITVAYGKESSETIQALKVTKTLPAPEVDPVKKGDTDVKVKVPTNGETKITVKVGNKEVVAEKDPNGQWKVGTKSVNTVDEKLQITVDPLKQGDVVKVTTEDPAGNQGQAEKQVPVDEYSAKPTDVKAKNEPAAPDKTTITGKATKGATITITDKDGKPLTTEPNPIIVGEDETFKATIDKKDPNTLLLVKAKEKGKEPSADAPVQVEGSSDVVPVDPNKNGEDRPKDFIKVSFEIKKVDQAKGSLEGTTAYYVNPKVDVQLNPPTFKAETGYKLDGWDQKDQMTIPAKKYTADTTIYAIIGEVADVVPGKDPNTGKDNEKPAGYVEIIFAVDGSKGKFADNAETKFFVNPNKPVTLTAPEVIKTDKTYTHEGWDNANWDQENKKFIEATYKEDTRITAKFVGGVVAAPDVGDVTTGDTKVDVNPGDADKVTVVVEGQGTIVVEKDPKDGNWKTPDGTVLTPDKDGKLPVPVKPIGEKALVEVTVEKDGVESEKVAKTAKKQVDATITPIGVGSTFITVTTYPAGATVTVYFGTEEIDTAVSNFLGVANLKLKRPTELGEYYKIKVTMDGYEEKVQDFKVE